MLDGLNKNPKVTLLVVMILVVGALVTIFGAGSSIPQKEPRLGLDLKGGSRLTLEAIPSADVPVIDKKVMDSLYYVIEKRVNGMGIAESIVQKAGEKRLIVEIPGVKDPDEARAVLGQVGKLEFRTFNNGQWVPSGVSGSDLARADVGADSTGAWQIQFWLNDKGTEKFGELTSKLAVRHEPLGIFFDGKYITSPAVQSAITQGEGVITGQFTLEEAQNIVNVLNAGALPVEVKTVEETTVGPLLGKSSINQSLFAGFIGLGLVALFMIGTYRLQGFVAVLALLVYTLLTYAIFLWLGVTFTLAGIAGFILSIGMAVDANILIFERTKEELRAGRSFMKAVDVGFNRAFPSIFDSNTTTLITCALLWMLGTGAVKGFALTLAVGVAVSMFSAITVTRTFLHLITGTDDRTNSMSRFGMHEPAPSES
jgi:preprotein translocase subunit SecD